MTHMLDDQVGSPGETSPSAGISAPREPSISLDGVGFTYPNGLVAIETLSLGIAPGEIVAVVGPSGCGKTTLLRLLAGLREPTAGEIVRAQHTGTDHRHPCAMVFQEDTVLPWMTVRNNVGLHYRYTRKFGRRMDKATAARIDELLTMVGLDGFGDYYPAKISGGMKRRVAVLTAVASMPQLLLLDEPFSALDEPTRIGVHGDIYRLIREFQVTTILVTHDLGEAISLSDRVILLSRVPARIVAEHSSPFPPERDLLEIRRTQAFLDFYGRVWGQLEEQIRAGEAPL